MTMKAASRLDEKFFVGWIKAVSVTVVIVLAVVVAVRFFVHGY